jgi:aspartyl-tRNA(Asn)/glutamyl-tRNA(Gln) amidotransferase subunit A
MDGMPAEIEALWQRGIEMLRDAGAEIRDISLPHTKYALPAYYVIAPAEASSNLARYDGVKYGHRAKLAQGDGITEMYEKTRAEGFGPEVQRRVMIGTYVLSAGFYDAYYNRARKVRALIKRDFETVFAEGVDAILTPATPSAAFGLGEMASAIAGGDVSERRLHRDGEPGWPARDLGSGGSGFAGPAAGVATDRPAVGRGGSA